MKLQELIGNTPLVELENINPNKRVKILGKLEGDNTSLASRQPQLLQVLVRCAPQGNFHPVKLIVR